MSLSKPRVTPDRHAAPALGAAAASNTGVLPLDAVYEVLLLLPAKELCRLRTVCRLWRSLLSDNLFAAAHAARHRDPLIAAGYATHMSNGVLADIMDLSGHVVKRVHAAADEIENEWVISAQLDRICIAKGTGVSCRLLNPATGVACALPEGLAEEHAAHEQDICHYRAFVALGQVASTGEYKVLRVLDCFPNTARQLYEVVTLDGTQWRGIPAPSYTVGLGIWAGGVIMDGIVYFSNELVQGQDVMLDRIASFDLETEVWRPTIRGPLSSLVDNAAGFDNDHIDWGELSMAILNDRLVVAHRKIPTSMDLWFLMDIEKGLWVKQYTIHVKINFQLGEHTVRPLVVLNDGRIVLIHIGNRGTLKIYNPRTGTSTDVAAIGPCVAVGLYTVNLLSLANGAR